MSTFVQPPFWAQGYQTWRRGSPHRAVQFLAADPPPNEPITIEDAKAFLRVTVADEDVLISRYITAARMYCENRVQRPIVAHTGDVFYDTVRLYDWITLPFAPVAAVESVKTTDTDGVQTTVDPSLYLVDLASDPARIGLKTGQTWPTVLRAFQAVVVRLTLGYTVVPEDIVQAMRFLVGHYYENRLATSTGIRSDATLPLAVEEHLAPYELVQVV